MLEICFTSLRKLSAITEIILCGKRNAQHAALLAALWQCHVCLELRPTLKPQEKAPCSSVVAWKIPWPEEPDGAPLSPEPQRAGHN